MPENKYFNPTIKHNNVFVKTKGYCTDVFFKQALGWIKERKDKSFFVYIPTNAPHGPFIVDEKYSDLYKDKTTGDSTSFFGMITNLDENMGLLMKKLDEWKLSDNTLLIFMTDNGSSRGTYNYGMKGRKGSPHEGGTRVPLFMRLPGKIKAGVDVDRLTRHYDIFPTLSAFAGAKLPEGLDLDGKNLIPLINDPKAKWKDRYVFFHTGRWNKKGAPGKWGKGNSDPDKAKYKRFAVRSEQWRLVEDKLYDIDKDPGETTNVAAEHPEIATEMRQAYDAWWLEVRPLMINEDAPLDTGRPFKTQFKKQQAAGSIPEWVAPSI